MNSRFGNNSAFSRARGLINEYDGMTSSATLQGTSIKTIILLAVTFISALLAIFVIGPIGILSVYVGIIIVDLIACFAICFFPKSAKYLAVPYAVAEGLMAGALTGILELVLPGVGFVLSSVALVTTMLVFLIGALLYLSGAIRVTNRFRKVMFTALLSILVFSIVVSILAIFIPEVGTVFSSGAIGIIVSLIMIVVASLYIVVSIDNAFAIVESGMEKQYEWYAAFGILINVIWLYYEILRLLIIIFGRNRD